MDGQPVWLASVSWRGPLGIIGTQQWSADNYRTAEKLALRALQGVGDRQRQRAFRMNVTFCVHRAISDAETDALPACWQGAIGGLAGGPVEVLWSRGIEHTPAAMPCANPGHGVLNPERPDLWFPEDCGQCEPCRARAAIDAVRQQQPPLPL